MRIGRAVVIAVFALAALATWFVVRQLPREEPVSLAAPQGPALEPTPMLPPPEKKPDGAVEVLVTGGGAPIRSAQVDLYLQLTAAPGEASPSWRVAGHAAVDQDGVAHVPAAPGTYFVAARAPGLAAGHGRAIRARGEAVGRVEIDLAPAIDLEGRAFSRDGQKPVRARIVATPVVRDGSAPAAAPVAERATGESDATGHFKVSGLAPGLYTISVEAAGSKPALFPRVALPRGPLEVAVDPLGRAQGEVRLADGKPAAGAAVVLAGREHSATATADKDGRFAIDAPAGVYRLLASAGGQAGAGPDAVSLATTAPATSLSVKLGPAAALEGTVIMGGEPLAGAQVAVFPHDATAALARARSGPDGRFAVELLPPGAYDLRAAAPGASPAFLGGLTIAAGQRFPAQVALPGTGAVEGTVRGASGQPLAGARVLVVSRGDGLAGTAPVEARTDFEGRYRIEELEVGRAELLAHEEDVSIGASLAVRVQEGRAARADLFLPESGLLAGRVSANGRRPPAGTAVVAAPMKGGLAARAARALVDSSGNFRLALPAGEYRVHAAPAEASASDLRVVPAFTTVSAGKTTQLDLAPAAATEERGFTVSVIEPGGAPSAGAAVLVSRGGEEKVAFATSTGEDGRVALAREMGVSGAITIRARNGGRAGSWTGTPSPDGSATVALAPGGAVEGSLEGRGKPPAKGFTLEVATKPSEGGWRTLEVHRFTGNRFELGDLPAEPLRITVRTADGRKGTADVTPAKGQVRALEVALEAEAQATKMDKGAKPAR